MPSQDDAPQLVRWLFGHLRWTLKTKPQTSAEVLPAQKEILEALFPTMPAMLHGTPCHGYMLLFPCVLHYEHLEQGQI